MIRSDLEKYSLSIITEYYRKNMDPMFDMLDEDVLWIGPRKGQVIRTRSELIRRFTSEPVEQEFRMGSITVQHVRTGSSSWEILLEYPVATIFPSGEKHIHQQRLHLSWGLDKTQRRKGPNGTYKIKMIHISNIQGMDSDLISARSPEDSMPDAVKISEPEKTLKRCIIHGKDGVTHYIALRDILYLESINGGKNTLVHTRDGEIPARERLHYFLDAYPDRFLQPHISYVINPSCAESLQRFTLTLTGGIEIPVPEKRFTAFKQELNAWISENL
ncbi:MAG: LytTR family transcriptional regulator [Eubacterium sp.]